MAVNIVRQEQTEAPIVRPEDFDFLEAEIAQELGTLKENTSHS